MVFSSITFLFLYLPVVLIIYHILFLPVSFGSNHRFWRNISNLFLMIMSLFFYFWGENYLVWILITSTFIDYLCGLIISGGWRDKEITPLKPDCPRTRRQKTGLVVSIISNLTFLGCFKYFNFGVDNINSFLTAAGLEPKLQCKQL